MTENRFNEPWTASGFEDVVVNNCKGHTIALHPGESLAEAKRAAKLMAAAPDLLNALVAMLEHEGERDVTGIGIECDSDKLEKAKIMARAAIASATL